MSPSKKTLFFASTATDICVLATLTGVDNGGCNCMLVDDCCATLHDGAREAGVGNFAVSGCSYFLFQLAHLIDLWNS